MQQLTWHAGAKACSFSVYAVPGQLLRLLLCSYMLTVDGTVGVVYLTCFH